MPHPRTTPGRRLLGYMLIVTALVVWSARANADEPQPAPSLTAAQQERLKELDRLEEQGQRLGAEGKLGAAMEADEAKLAIEREVFGPASGNALRTLGRLAGGHEMLNDWAAATKARREILDRRIATLGRDHWAVTDARLALEDVEARARMTDGQRHRLAEAGQLQMSMFELNQKGSYKEAVPLARRVVAIRKEVLGERHPDCAKSLSWLAYSLNSQGELAEARSLYEQALAITKEVLGERHPDYATSLNNLAETLLAQGNLESARSLLERTLEIRKEALGERHPDFAASLYNLANLLESQGKLVAARPLYERSLAINKEVLGDRHPIYVQNLDNWADFLASQGDLAAARPLWERVLWIRKEMLGERDPLYAASLNNLATLFMTQGDLAGARPLYERVLAIRKEVLGERHPDYAQSLHNLAFLLQSEWDLTAARPLFERAVALRKEVLAQGERHPDYTSSLNHLAVILVSQQNPDAARPLAERALALRRDVLGERHPFYAMSLNNLAVVLRAQGDLAGARPLAERALALRKEILNEHNPDYAQSLESLALILQAQGEFASARPLVERALALRKDGLGKRHPDYATSLANLALLLVAQGDLAGARPLAEEMIVTDERHVAEMLPVLGVREQIALLDHSNLNLSILMSLSIDEASRGRENYSHLLARKGLTAEAAAIRAAADRPEARAARAALGPLRKRLQMLTYRRVPAGRADDLARQVRELTEQVATKEAELARAVGWRPEAPDPGRVAATLPTDAAFVDIVRYVCFSQPAPGGHDLRREQRYLAFVVRAGCPPARLELGPAAAIDEALAAWRERLVAGRDAEEVGRNLARLIWQPLTPHLDRIRTVLVSPDADTCFLPWGALPDKEPGSVLLQRYAFVVIGSARQLLALAGARAEPAGGGLLAVGGVNYDAAEAGPSPRATLPPLVATRAVPTGASLLFPEIPGTATEAAAIAAIARRAQAGNVDPASGPHATEEALRAAMPGHRYLHLATHGYFAPPELKSVLAPQDEPTALRSWEGMGRAEVSGYYPGLLSGLVWAGANHPPTDPITGAVDIGAALMTAEEVSGLDLKGCELAVLSACETGLGRTAGGEGVLGLQGAFHQAGCRTVVASLWKVDDAATSALMTRFYTNLWEKKLPPLESLRQAQLSILDDPEFGDGGNPRLWAAWTLSGDPGGLRTLPPSPGAKP